MNKVTLTLISILMTVQLFGQTGFGKTEFETHQNGLIYSEITMNKLGRIVDSLNLKYKVCDLNKKFYSKSQTIGHIIKLNEDDIKQAKKDMDNNIPFDSFISKYPNAKIEKYVLIVKYKYKKSNF